MRNELFEYKVTPIAFLIGEQEITIRAKNERCAFVPETEYRFRVREVSRAPERFFPGSGGLQQFTLKAGRDGAIRLAASFPREGMYLIHLIDPGTDKPAAEFRVYALGEDMRGRYPLRGDLHLHSCRSDGREDPYTVAANYRERGLDFIILSDHRRYYPSLQAREKFRIGPDDKSPITGLLILPGEEVHLPNLGVHYINCGSSFSVNALVTPNKNQEYLGDDPRGRSLTGECPPVMTEEAFNAMIAKRAEGIDREIESERLAAAAAEWTYEMVKKGGGIGIFPHPYWLCRTMQLSEDFLYYFYEKKPFDAFEVLGGERYFQHNGFQTVFYYENKAKGLDYPVVGSTDSHGSTVRNPNAFICSTVAFAR